MASTCFAPGKKSTLKSFIKKQYLYQQYHSNNPNNNNNNENNFYTNSYDVNLIQNTWSCISTEYKQKSQSYNDSTLTENNRISRLLTGTLGGKITYGSCNRPVKINYLGGWEGQPGGMPRQLRNKF